MDDQQFVGSIVCVGMVIMDTFQFIDKFVIAFIWFIVVIIQFKVRVNRFAASMEYNVFSFTDIYGHFIGTEPSGNCFDFGVNIPCPGYSG
jgi:hypothetical protein